MARFRSSIRPVKAVKNIVDGTFLGVGATVQTIVNLVDTVNDYTGLTATVPIGSTVNGVYLFVQMIDSGSTVTNVDWYVYKRNGLAAAVTPVDPGSTGGNVIRKLILHEEKGIPGNALDGAYPLTFKGVIKIPRGMRRFGEGDQLKLVMRGTSAYNACVKCIYKFYQ